MMLDFIINNIWKSAFTLIFLFIFHRYVVRPYLFCQYYVKQGIYLYKFVPVLGILPESIANVQKNGDLVYSSKILLSEKPELQNAKAIMCNFGSTAVINLIDPTLVGLFLNQFH